MGGVWTYRNIQKRNPVEEELAKMGIENWEVVPTTGDKGADAYIKRILGKYTERYLTKDINSNYYKKLTGKKKSVYFKGLLAEYRKEAKNTHHVAHSSCHTSFGTLRWSPRRYWTCTHWHGQDPSLPCSIPNSSDVQDA